MRASLIVGAMLSVSVLLAGALIAGPLNPPAGPVASSFKTLTEVEPRIPLTQATTPGDGNSIFRITAPGSYYLTGNVTGISGKSGIELASNGVTIDLNGYTLQGVAGSLDGIVPDTGLRTSIIIRNGMISGWGNHGIDLDFGAPTTSQGSVIESVIAVSNAGDGIRCPDGSSVSNCVSARNAGHGFSVANSATFSACTAQGNGLNGFGGGFGCVYTSCVARGNTGAGFAPNGTSNLTHCSATSNGFIGFDLTSSQAVACTSVSNSTSNYRCASNCYLLQCDSQNSTVGFDVTGSGNRLEGNKCTNATTGFRVSSTSNLVIGNAATGGTTRYSIVAGNSVGPILTAAFIGTATNPTANFDY